MPYPTFGRTFKSNFITFCFNLFNLYRPSTNVYEVWLESIIRFAIRLQDAAKVVADGKFCRIDESSPQTLPLSGHPLFQVG